MRSPNNWVKPWLRCRCLAAALAPAAKRRCTMSGAQTVDIHMAMELSEALPDQKAKDILMIQSGALWTGHAMHKAGFRTSPSCPWCGAGCEDLKHLWWECPAFEHLRVRARDLLKGRSPECLPSCIALHGIPVGPAADLLGRLWRTQDCPAAPSEKYLEQAMDLQGDDRIAWIDCCEWVCAEMGEQRHDANIHSLTIRQMAQWLQGGFTEFPLWQAGAVHDHPPSNPSLYTDGSVTRGRHPWTAQGV